jgi:DNA-binding NarL/FixJ family response regulator
MTEQYATPGVFIIDDNENLRELMEICFVGFSDIEVRGSADSADSAVALLPEIDDAANLGRPIVVVLDGRFPNRGDAEQWVEQAGARGLLGKIGVICFSNDDMPESIDGMANVHYLHKQESMHKLVDQVISLAAELDAQPEQYGSHLSQSA